MPDYLMALIVFTICTCVLLFMMTLCYCAISHDIMEKLGYDVYGDPHDFEEGTDDEVPSTEVSDPPK